jgi:DNA-directed RNA polymerase subunit RPC12/RpoP
VSAAVATLVPGFEPSGPGDKPFWAKCVECGHCWAAAYLPMDIRTLARVTKNAACPRCGGKRPVVAKQGNGVLKEPGQSA